MITPDFWTAYWVFTSFVFGAIVGSFLNVCIWRLPRGESLGFPPSHCPSCLHTLKLVPDMVPLFSQLRTRSSCRYCGAHYSWRYFWVELVTAVLFAALYLRFVVYSNSILTEGERTAAAICVMVFVSAMLVIFVTDLEHFQVQDIAVYIAAAAGIALDLLLLWKGGRSLSPPLFGWLPVPPSILTGLASFWLLWQFAAVATAALGKEAMGAGDPLLLGAMGALLVPWPLNLLAFMIAVTLGAIIGGAMQFWPRGAGEAPAAAGQEENLEAALDPDYGGSSGATAGEESAQESGAAPQYAEAPRIPAASRDGRLLTVAGVWAALGALQVGGMLLHRNPAGGAAVMLAGLAGAALLLRSGIRLWLRGDAEWQPANDEFFEEGEMGPRYIPFGPYLVTGALIAIFFGRPILSWVMVDYMGIPAADFEAMDWI